MRIEFYFDFSCPFAYLGSLDVEGVARRTGATLEWKPMLLGGVFRDIGHVKSVLKAKERHNQTDQQRWAELRGAPLLPAPEPQRTVRALRTLLAIAEDHRPEFIHAIYRAYWEHQQDINSEQILKRCLQEAEVVGTAADRALAANDDQSIKDELRQRTDEAVARGAFGAPYIIVSREPGTEYRLWGQDRLAHAESILRGWDPSQNQPPTQEQFVSAGASWGSLASSTDPQGGIPVDEAREPATIEFWYDFSSPYSYLAATQVEAMAARAGAQLKWCPMLLGAVFKSIGTANVPLLAMPEPKRAWMYEDLDLWAAWWGVDFVFASQFPQKTVTALRLALLAGGRISELSLALYRRIWVDNQSLEDEQVLRQTLRDLDLDSDALLEQTRDPEVKQKLIANTSLAVERGVFGAPAFVVQSAGESRLFWGQDRLELVERAASGLNLPSL